MIIDCHGHYTTSPTALSAYRKKQLAWMDDRTLGRPRPPLISDQEIIDSIAGNQLRLMDERGEDIMLISPRASGMEHHRPDRGIARDWARVSNDLVHRVASLFPGRFAAVCQLPQTPGGSMVEPVRELRRCVEELGFVGCNLNPDPSGGFWTARPLTDPFWFPLYEAMAELDVPAMIHVSSSDNPAVNTLGGHYLNADTTVFMQLVEGDLFSRFPTLRLVIPHGGGAVPYHWGRFEGLSVRMGKPPLAESVLGNVFFDTCVYHQAGFDLLTRIVPAANLLFAAEMLGAVRGNNPSTGAPWDDTKRYLDAAGLSFAVRRQIEEENVRRVYPRLNKVLS
ncbi:amidohydrolase family protein [Actinoplanes sp. NPDC051513]|uniref:amidohydrolase family protein n=1 Tax=Actinoplanes sp. NPDC051513 TaxID=3363908 RepID=UPI0037B60A11